MRLPHARSPDLQIHVCKLVSAPKCVVSLTDELSLWTCLLMKAIIDCEVRPFQFSLVDNFVVFRVMLLLVRYALVGW